MSIEAMKLALEALDDLIVYSWDDGKVGEPDKTEDYAGIKAMEALRTAIEQAEKQEPVAWGVPNTRPTEKAQFMMLLHSPDGCQYPKQLVPLYTTPPQRQLEQAEKQQSETELVEALRDLLEMPEHDGTFSMGSLRKSIKDRAKAILKKAEKDSK